MALAARWLAVRPTVRDETDETHNFPWYNCRTRMDLTERNEYERARTPWKEAGGFFLLLIV